MRYEYSLNGGNTYATISSALPMVNGKYMFNVYDLVNGQTYIMAVRSVNLLGTSPWSNKPVIAPYTYPIEPTIVDMISLRGGIQVVLDPTVNNGGNTISSYKFAYVVI